MTLRLALVSLFAALVATVLAPVPGQAGAPERRDQLRTQVAVLAERLGNDRQEGRRLPARLTRKILSDRYGYELPRPVFVQRYTRLSGTNYEICLRHRNGGWATFSTRSREVFAQGRGSKCRF